MRRPERRETDVSRGTGESRPGPLEPLQIARPVNTHVGFGTAVDHMEGAVGQIEASEAAGSLCVGGGGAKGIHKSVLLM